MKESIPVEEVAKRLGRNVDTIRAGLRQGVFPFGKAYQTTNGQWVFVCSRQAFEHFMQYGEQPLHQYIVIRQEDFDTLAKTIIAG